MRPSLTVGVLAVAIWGCGKNSVEPSITTEAQLKIDLFCERLPGNYSLILGYAQSRKYAVVGRIWMNSDGATGVHDIFEFCLNGLRLPDADRQEIFTAYFEEVRQLARPVVTEILSGPEGETDENHRALLAQLEKAKALADRLIRLRLTSKAER